ncbi:MAG TPA: glycosyltransferase family 4 protein [Natronosporangium sp.]
MKTVHVVLPGRVVEAAVPSGGDAYDRRICDGLAAAGWSVRELVIPGDWPRPGPAGVAALAAGIAECPDGAVVLVDGLVAGAAPEVLVPAADRLRLVVIVHLPLADETGLAPAAADELAARERRTLHAAAAVVVTSGWSARRLVELHDLPADRVHVAHPGVDPAPLAPGTDGASGLLCVAAVTPLKAQDLLVTALARVADLPWRCRCVGDLDRVPDYAARVRELVRQHRLTDRIELAGPRTGAELAADYAAADLVLLVSHAESYGMVLTEALARGIPVLATDVGGVPEAVGRTPDGSLPGMLIPPGDPAALAAALRRWLARGETRRQLRDAARARRATLTGWQATVATVAGVLEVS